MIFKKQKPLKAVFLFLKEDSF